MMMMMIINSIGGSINPLMGHNKGLPMDDKLGHLDETQHHHHDQLSWGSSIHG
jgi:hypothetical protein